MKIIINRGIEKLLTRILIYKNGNRYGVSVTDSITIDSNEGDTIVIKLKSLDITTVTIASFVCVSKNDIIFIYPSIPYKIWDAMNFIILPYSCMLLASLRLCVQSEIFGWGCTSLFGLTAISLICQKLSVYVPVIKKRMYIMNRL